MVKFFRPLVMLGVLEIIPYKSFTGSQWLALEVLRVVTSLAFTLSCKVYVDGVRRQDVELASQPMKSMSWKRVCENIRRLIFAIGEGNLQAFDRNLFWNEVKVNIDIFCSGMKNGIDSQVGGTNVITT